MTQLATAQVAARPHVNVADRAIQTPFADVHFFHSNQQLQIKATLQNLDQLKAYLLESLKLVIPQNAIFQQTDFSKPQN